MNKKFLKILKFIWFFVLFIWIFYSFYKINSFDYKQIKKIKLNKTFHPEFIPDSNFAKITSFWFKNVRADYNWLESIQYIGSNAISSAYKKYLYPMLNLITDLNPYFINPYKIWMLLLPDYNPRYESLNDDQKLKYIKQAEALGLKWIKNFCDKKKIEAIKKEDNLQKIWTLDKYKNPCKNYIIPYYLAYIYYFYLKDPKTASDYYKITSANTDSLEWAKILAAIMKWKGWDREKAFLMFLNIWKTLDNSKDKTCSNFIDLLQNKYAYSIFRQDNLDPKLIKYINDLRAKLFDKKDKKQDNKINLDTQCQEYANKAVRELNLYYIEQANKKYFKDTWENAKNAKVLYDKGYIKYLPIDYQQEKDYWIIYKYDKELGHFDYSMWNYD